MRCRDCVQLAGMLTLGAAMLAGMITPGAATPRSRQQMVATDGSARGSEQDRWEELFLSVPSNESAREHLQRITATDHVAGTAQGLAVAKFVQAKLAEALEAEGAGVTVVMDAVKVLLASPVNRSVEMRSGDGSTYKAPLSEPELPNDATSGSRWRNKTFLAYAPSGRAEAELVYANYGSPDDFDALAKMGVSVQGKIVIVRYGSSFRGLKVMNAQERGAAGVLIYSDPMEDGYAVGKVPARLTRHLFAHTQACDLTSSAT